MAVNMGEAVGYIRLNIEDFNRNAAAVKSAVGDLETQLNGLGSICSKAADIAGKAFAALSVAATAAFKSAISTGSQFESAMSQVAATMGMTVDQMESATGDYQRLKEAAEEAGASTKFSATQSAEALNYLALAGYDASEAISALPTVLNLAAAGGMDLALASDMLTDAVSALGLGLEDMSFFADQMAKTAQSSNTSVEQLGNAILQIGGTAKSLAGGVTELDTALGVLANNGIKSAEAGTSLRQIILNLTAPTDKAKKYMEELGLAVKDAAGNVRPLNDIFRDLDEILQSKGITGTADMTEALANIFDARQLKSANALLANYGDTWDELYYKIENAEGAASTMAEVMSTNLTGAITTFRSALEGVAISFSEAFTGKLTEAVNTATGNIRQLNEVIQSPATQKALINIANTISDVIVKLSEIAVDVIPKVIDGISYLIDNFDNIKVIISGVIVVAAGLTTAFTGIKVLLTAAAAQALLTSTAFTGMAAAIAPVAAPLLVAGSAIALVAVSIQKAKKEAEENIKVLSEQYDEVYITCDAMQDLEKSYSRVSEEIENMYHQNDEQINYMRDALDVLNANVTGNGYLKGSEEEVKKALEEINKVIPINTELQNGQIKGYEELISQVDAYCLALERQATLQAAQAGYNAALDAYDNAAEKRVETQQELLELTEKNNEAQRWLKRSQTEIGYFNLKATEEAKKLGRTQNEWIIKNAVTTQEALDAATKAYAANNAVYDKASEDLENYKDQIITTKNDIAQANNEAFLETYNESNDALGWQRAIAKKEAENRVEMAKQASEEKKEVELQNQEELDEKLDELERKFNLGEIENEKDYHDQRLKLYEDYTGQKTLIYSQGYKKEIDYQKKYNEDQQKAAEDALEKQKQQGEVARKEAEKQAEELKKAKEKETRELIKSYDKRKETDKKYSDTMYLNDLFRTLQTVEKDSDLYKELYEKITDYNRKRLEQSIQDEYNAIKDRKKLNEDYTNEQYLSDLQKFSDKLDKESDLYKEVSADIISVSKDIAEAQQKAADESFKAWESGLNAIIDTAEKEYNSIMSKQQSLEDMLNNQIDLFELTTKKAYNATTGLWEDVESEQISKEYLDKQYNDIVAFERKLQALKDRGISESLMSKILAMSPEDQKKIVSQLDNMSDNSLKAYDESYNRLLQKNKDFAAQFYSDELDTFKTAFGDEVSNYFLTLPEEAKKAGQDTVKAFIDGIQEGESPDFIKDTIGVEWGKNERLFSDEGTIAGNAFFNSFTAQIAGIKDIFSGLINIPDIQSKVNEFMRSMYNPMFANAYSSFFPASEPKQAEFMRDAQILGSSLTKNDLIEAIQAAMPSGDIVLNVADEAFASVSRKALNRYAGSAGDMGLQI